MKILLLITFGLTIAMIFWEVAAFGIGIDAKGQLIKNEKIGYRVMGTIIILLIIFCLCTGGFGGYHLFLLLV